MLNPYTQLMVDWLIQEDCYQSFMRNLHDDPDEPNSLEEYMVKNNVVNLSQMSSLVGGAFAWSDTYEGDIFWENIDTKWTDYIDELLEISDTLPTSIKIYKIKDYK